MTHRLTRRSLLALGGASLAAAAVRFPGGGPAASLAVTASPTTPGAIAHPTGAADLVLRVETGGGFVPVEFMLAELPLYSLYGSGQLLHLGPQIEIYPQPALPNLRSIRLTEAQIQETLTAAREAGLLDGDQSYTEMPVADAPATTFTVDADGARNVVVAYALGFDETMVPDAAERAARARLIDFLDRLGRLVSSVPQGADEPYAIERLQIVAWPVDPANPPGADQDLAQPPVAWPLDVPLSAFGEAGGIVSPFPGGRCGAVDGNEAQTLLTALQGANQLTPWESDGALYQLVVRPLLPDEAPCGNGSGAGATPAAA